MLYYFTSLASYLTFTELAMDSRKERVKEQKESNSCLRFCLPSGTMFCLFFTGMMNTDQTKFKTHREVVSCMYYKNSLGPQQGNILYDFTKY